MENIAKEKLNQLKTYVEESGVTGVEFTEVNEDTHVLYSRFLIQGQEVPFMVAFGESVYTYIRIYVVNQVPESSVSDLILYLNRLNETYSMLKYIINEKRQLLLECSVPAPADQFNPAFLVILIDELKRHLEGQYADLMKQVWKG